MWCAKTLQPHTFPPKSLLGGLSPPLQGAVSGTGWRRGAGLLLLWARPQGPALSVSQQGEQGSPGDKACLRALPSLSEQSEAGDQLALRPGREAGLLRVAPVLVASLKLGEASWNVLGPQESTLI